MRIVIIALATIVCLACAAHACPPPPAPPPPMEGESVDAYQARMEALRAEQAAAWQVRWAEIQRGRWDESESVLLARVERTDSTTMWDLWGRSIGRFPRAHLRPVRWLKGSGPSRPFHLTYVDMTSCGPFGGGEAVEGAVGEVFIVFVRSGRPSQRSVIESLALANITAPELRARVDEALSIAR